MSYETVAQLHAAKEKIAFAQEKWSAYVSFSEYGTAKLEADNRLKSKSISVRIKALNELRNDLHFRVQGLARRGCLILDEFWLGSMEDLIEQHLPDHSNGPETAIESLHHALDSLQSFFSRTHLFINISQDKRAKGLPTIARAVNNQLELCQVREIVFLGEVTTMLEKNTNEFSDMEESLNTNGSTDANESFDTYDFLKMIKCLNKVEKLMEAKNAASQLLGILDRETAAMLETASMFGITLSRQSLLDDFLNVPKSDEGLLWQQALPQACAAIARWRERDQDKPIPECRKRITDFYSIEQCLNNSASGQTTCKQDTQTYNSKSPKSTIDSSGEYSGPNRTCTRQQPLGKYFDLSSLQKGDREPRAHGGFARQAS